MVVANSTKCYIHYQKQDSQQRQNFVKQVEACHTVDTLSARNSRLNTLVINTF